MDIFARDHSVSFLRTTGKKRYPITVGDKVYQCRQVLLDTTKFADYLFRKKSPLDMSMKTISLKMKNSLSFSETHLKLSIM